MTGNLERAGMRASDADRDAVAQRLQVAVDEGRLDLSDYDERLRGLYGARTYGELERFTADLPVPDPAPAAAAAKAERKAAEQRRQMWDEWRSWLGGALIMLAIWGGTSIASADLFPFWPAIPLGIWAAVLFAGMIGGDSRKCG